MLADELIERPRPHPGGQRRVSGRINVAGLGGVLSPDGRIGAEERALPDHEGNGLSWSTVRR